MYAWMKIRSDSTESTTSTLSSFSAHIYNQRLQIKIGLIPDACNLAMAAKLHAQNHIRVVLDSAEGASHQHASSLPIMARMHHPRSRLEKFEALLTRSISHHRTPRDPARPVEDAGYDQFLNRPGLNDQLSCCCQP